MNALAGGGTFATLPALIAIGLPANVANATSNVALLPGAATSAWAFRHELEPVARISPRLLGFLTFIFGTVGSLLLFITPAKTFDILVPWLLLFAFAVMVLGKQATDWLHARITIGRTALLAAQAALGIYGGYFGGGVGLITTALYGLLANISPRELFALRVIMLAIANCAAGFVFIGLGMVVWWACLPMILGAIAGGWIGALIGKRLSSGVIRIWTLLVTGCTTAMFFFRAYAS